MTPLPPHGVPVLDEPLVQPDGRSCGAAVLVVARMWQDAAHATSVRSSGGFAAEVLATHRQVTGPVDATGRAQLPWPRALGTPPWAVARRMGRTEGPDRPAATYCTRVVWPWRRRRVWEAAVSALRAGRPVPVYVGSRWLPRHVVLGIAVGETGVVAYDPAVGRAVDVTPGAFVAGRLRLRRWSTPWFVVLPR